jgi:hypothetical protein
MKSNGTLVVIALLSLILGVVSSAVLWSEVSSTIKIGMFAFGFGSGVAAGAWIAGRQK